MKITRVSYERLDLSLSEPYTIAYETVTKSVNFILKIETEGKIVGYGCSSPDLEVTGETPQMVESAIEKTVVPLLKNQNPFHYAKHIEELKSIHKQYASVRAMVDMALLDLVSKKANVPLYQFLGGYRESIPTSITIGILPIDKTIERATKYIAQGFYILKIKGGLSLEEDIEKIKQIRTKFPKVIIRFDGNQGYSTDDSVTFVKATKNFSVEIFEQPTKKENEVSMGQVTKQVHLPVMADESIKTLADVFRLAQNERIDMVNIKLMKVGGILEGMHINSVAKSASLEAMVGCNDECGLGIAAGLHFALSRPNIQYADLDGHLDILNDPYKNIVLLKNGILYPSENPGLGTN
ncbi:MAG: dipeptide epimerase [Croceitalea sp.]|nr:dipeptide epimerase [Croceitalea sp.]